MQEAEIDFRSKATGFEEDERVEEHRDNSRCLTDPGS